MNDFRQLPSIDQLKQQAKNLRNKLNEEAQNTSHSQSLEIVARQYGFRDWNTLYASAGNSAPRPILSVGDRVQGTYLGQKFKADVLSVQFHPVTNRTRVTFDFDEAVDVVSFDSFSAFRKRVSCFLKNDGTTAEKTSNGSPQMVLNL